MGFVILFLHSLNLPYNYFEDIDSIVLAVTLDVAIHNGLTET